MPDYWKNRPIYRLTGLSRQEFLETLRDPIKRKSLEKYLNLVKQVVNEN